jgi:hypothetical protein
MLSGLGAIAGACAIVVAALLGESALSDYRRQKLVDREIGAAESVLTAGYRALDAVEQMRGRWIPGHESYKAEEVLREAGMNLEGMPENEKRAYVTSRVIYHRAEFFKNDFDAAFEAIPVAKVYFGQETVERLKQFPKARNRMLMSADMLHLASNNSTVQDREFAVGIRRDVFGARPDDTDEIRDMTTTAMVELENQLLPKLRAEKDKA